VHDIKLRLIKGASLVLCLLCLGCSPAARMRMACPGAPDGVSASCKAWAQRTLEATNATPADREQAENYLKEATGKPMPPMPISPVQIQQTSIGSQWTDVTGSLHPNLCSNLGGGHDYCF